MAYVTLRPDQKFAVGKIIAVGRNYSEHVKEMGAEKDQPPVLFLKPPTAILHTGNPIHLPAFSNEVHHEIELALLIGVGGKEIHKKDWKKHVAGAGIALDLTLRDLQNSAKEKGNPWTISKGFDGSCPISQFTPLDRISDLHALQLELSVNGVIKQSASTQKMIYAVDELLTYASTYFTLEPGDIILTGTPAGVGKIISGDILLARISELGEIQFTVA
jgi:2-keto-4-pentenoate hydratase/2-oxohepta-3-ene-1,7-dioic acid hydratase in catechol pathway